MHQTTLQNTMFRNSCRIRRRFRHEYRKIIIHELATSRSTTDENSYAPKQFHKNTGRIGGKLKPQDKDSTRLEELSLMNNTHFGPIQYDIHLDMKVESFKKYL